MVAGILALALLSGAQAPLPPYKRVETVALNAGYGLIDSAVSGSKYFALSYNSCTAYDLSTLKPAWTQKLPKAMSASKISVDAGKAYITANHEGNRSSRLLVLLSKTGKQLWTANGSGGAGTVAVMGNTIYVGLGAHSVSAINATTHKLKWTTQFPASKDGGFGDSVEGIVAVPTALAVNYANVTRGLRATDGKVIWNRPKSYLLSRKLVAEGGIVWTPTEEGSAGIEIASGKVLWNATAAPSDSAEVFSGRFVGIHLGKLYALNPKTGEPAWSYEVGTDNSSGGNQYTVALRDKLFVCGMKKAAIFNDSGKVLWTDSSENALPAPIFASGSRLICADRNRLLAYVHGSNPALPTDSAHRQALAAQMVSHFRDLDDEGIRTLKKLGDDAFPAVLAALLKAGAGYDAHKEGAQSSQLYDDYHSLGKVLMEVGTSKTRTPELLTALSHIKGDGAAKPWIIQVAGQYGDPKLVMPALIKELDGVKTPGFEMYESSTFVARGFVVESSDPAAVAFMMRQLKDPKADRVLKEEAYDHLAGTGGAEGLKAVLAERHARKLLPPLAQRVVGGYLGAGEFGTHSRVLHEKTDAGGRTWGLLQCGILGSAGDLWLAEKVNGKWTNPLFTGVSLNGVSRWAKPAPPEPKIGGKTGKQLEAGAWFDVLVNNDEIRKDSTECGVTDLEKKRLGLDPTKKDTDGDGDADDVDPWPNASQRTLTDAEQVVAAVFEARYHFDGSQGPALFFAPWDMKPFEMPGRHGPTLWVPFSKERHDWALPLEQCYEQGVAFINITPGNIDEHSTKTPELIQWNADKTEATVGISTYYGGLNGTGYTAVVRKFGADWVVVSLKMAYVS